MDDADEKLEEPSRKEDAKSDEISNITVLESDGGKFNEKAQNEEELISASNSSKEDEIMSSKVPTKARAIRKGPVKKKTAAASTKNKNQSKFKLKAEVRESDSEGNSSDEKFLEEFESDGSDFSSSTDSDDLSQEFSDEDRLMEYYEKKLREHAIVGNFVYNSDLSDDSEPTQELKKLVEETFKPKPKLDQVNDSTPSPAKKAVKLNKREQAKLTKPSGKLQLSKGFTATEKSSSIKVDMKSVISGLKFERVAAQEPASKKIQMLKRTNSDNRKPVKSVNNAPASLEDRRTLIAPKPTRSLLNPLDLTKPGSNRTRSQAVSISSSTQPNFGRIPQQNGRTGASDDAGSYQKVVDYLARIKKVMNRKIDVDAEDAADLEILKSARAAILEQRDRNKKSTQFSQKINGVPASASGSTSTSESDSAISQKHLKDDVVDRILNATLGVS